MKKHLLSLSVALLALFVMSEVSAQTKYTHYYQNLPCAVEEVQEVVQDEVAVPVQEAVDVDVNIFSDQALWDELKRRGYSADERGLFIVKKTYLN